MLIAARSPKTPNPGALHDPKKRAQLFHTFLHHELQAAELMAWALLAYPDTPLAFRKGLLRILLDEVRHMNLYQEHLLDLGFTFGDFPVRDWFWERVPLAPTPIHFVAVMGVGFEGGNLDHAARFAAQLHAAGDTKAAAIQTTVGTEEVSHVRFALHWFTHWTQSETFTAWKAHLPPPLSPLLMRGSPINYSDRERAGFSTTFLDELSAWQPEPRGS